MIEAVDLTEKSTVLVVGDTPDNLTLMSGLLKRSIQGEGCQQR